MRVALRPYATAGIAIAGASVIAVTPITPPPTEAQTRAVELSAAVRSLEPWDPAAALTGPSALVGSEIDASPSDLSPPDLGVVFDTIAQWADLLTTSLTNVGGIGQQWLADPAPFLRQVVTNQFANATLIADTMGSAIPTVLRALLDPSFPNGFASSLVKAIELVQANDITGASSAIYNGLVGTAFGLFPMANLLQIPVQMSANLNNVLETTASLPISVGFGAIRAVGHFFTSAGVSGQAVSDALAEQDPVAALEALISTPGNITGAVLNGDRFGGGLLSDNGLIATLLVGVPGMLADAITPETVDAQKSLSDVLSGLWEAETAQEPEEIESADAVKTPAPAKVVTLTVEPQAEPEPEPTEPTAEAASTETGSASDGPTALSDGNKVTPGTGSGTGKHRKPTKLDTALKSIGKDVENSFSKVADGVKKALGGDKKGAENKAKADTGSGSSADGGTEG